MLPNHIELQTATAPGGPPTKNVMVTLYKSNYTILD